jgi:hypothetical protein
VSVTLIKLNRTDRHLKTGDRVWSSDNVHDVFFANLTWFSLRCEAFDGTHTSNAMRHNADNFYIADMDAVTCLMCLAHSGDDGSAPR